MKLPAIEHTSRPWRIHELTRDFRLEDVWALPTPGGPDDFPRLYEALSSFDPSHAGPWLSRVLFDIRWRLGELFGWDRPDAGTGSRVPSLRARLPDDLRACPAPAFQTDLPFTSLYMTGDEWAAETANRTCHGVLHVSWVPDPKAAGGYRGQMAILVKPNGLFGQLYMAGIMPFRYLIVYPALLREIEKMWAAYVDSAAEDVGDSVGV